MTYVVPGSIKAAFAVTINGHSFAKNDVLTAAQVKGIRHLSALLSNGTLIAVPDPGSRKAQSWKPGNPSPVYLPPSVISQFGEFSGGTEDELVTVTMAGHHASLEVQGGTPPFSVAWGDTHVEVLPGRTAEHVYAGPVGGTFNIVVTGAEGEAYPTQSKTVAALAFTAAATLLNVTTFTVTGAHAPFTVDWGDLSPAAAPPGSSPFHHYAIAGTYHVVVTDADGVLVAHDLTVVAS